MNPLFKYPSTISGVLSPIIKYLNALLFALLAALEPTVPFAVILLVAILLDCASAYNLNRRLAKQHPGKVTGKFQSKYAWKMAGSFLQAYSVIVLLHLVDVMILVNFPYLNLSNIGAAVFCGLQVSSILENYSSANGARWAKVLQKILVDKSERHFNIKLEEDEKEEH